MAGWLLALGLRRERGAAVQRDKVFDLGQMLLVVWTLVALGILFWSIQQGLLGTPEMQIAGNGSTDFRLRWYADRAGAVPPTAWMLSVGVENWARPESQPNKLLFKACLPPVDSIKERLGRSRQSSAYPSAASKKLFT